MARNLLLSVHGCVCLSLIKLSTLARRKPVDFLFPCYIHEGAPAAVLDEEGSFIWVLRLFPGGGVLLWDVWVSASEEAVKDPTMPGAAPTTRNY